MSGWNDLFADRPRGAVARHTVTLAGQVLDARSARPIADAVVTITAGPAGFTHMIERLAALEAANPNWEPAGERPDQRASRANGGFGFIDLDTGGDYTLRAAAPQLGSRYGTAEVTAAPGNFKIVMQLPPTCINGTLRDTSGNPVVGARVALVGGDTLAWTDEKGNFTLGPITKGTWSIAPSRAGYVALAGQPRPTLTVAQGETQTIALVLQKKPNGSG